MTQWGRKSRWTLLACSLLLFGLASVGCEETDEGNGTPTEPSDSTPEPEPTQGEQGFLRVAQLTIDARTIDVLINGEPTFQQLGFPEVSDHTELDAADYRVQFFPAGQRTLALMDTIVTLPAGEALTVSLVGSSSFQTVVTEDELSTGGDQARARLFNAVSDFPAHLDLRIFNGPVLFQEVRFKRASDYVDVIPGIYDLELLRAGTNEVVASSFGQLLGSGATHTIFAVGTLSRGDIALHVVRDSS